MFTRLCFISFANHKMHIRLMKLALSRTVYLSNYNFCRVIKDIIRYISSLYKWRRIRVVCRTSRGWPWLMTQFLVKVSSFLASLQRLYYTAILTKIEWWLQRGIIKVIWTNKAEQRTNGAVFHFYLIIFLQMSAYRRHYYIHYCLYEQIETGRYFG